MSPLMLYPPLRNKKQVGMKSVILSNDMHDRHISEPIKRENRAETTSPSVALTSLPSHVTEVILSLG